MKRFNYRRFTIEWKLFSLLAFLCLLSKAFAQPQLRDIWGRNLQGQQIILVDWEGHIANPALRFSVAPPPDAQFPVTVDLQGDNPRLYFNIPSEVSANGPRKRLTFSRAEQSISFWLSIFPDRDALSEEHRLTITSRDANRLVHEISIPIQVVDQDRVRPPAFNLIVNRSQDATGFFSNAEHFRIARLAAEDWAYFIADMAFDVVPREAETSYIWARDGSNGGRWIKNSQPYQGFLLYIYGVQGPSLISGGQGSWDGGIQSSGGRSLNLRRSGTYQAHVAGNYNRLGWFLTESDDDWLWTNNYGDRPNDLYSIAHHEIGHALFFDGSHPHFARAKANGKIDDSRVVAYHGAPVVMDGVNHFPTHVDRASRFGAFGNEYHGEMPPGRWLITKLDLLCAQATGYILRPTSAFEPLRILETSPLEAAVDQVFRRTLLASGGIPFFHWEIIGGSLPAGFSLNSFTGEISGTTATTGTYHFEVRLREYDEQSAPVTNAFAITVRTPPQLEISGFVAGVSLSLRVTHPVGELARIEESNDLEAWQPIVEHQMIPFEMPVELKDEPRFYRALQLRPVP